MIQTYHVLLVEADPVGVEGKVVLRNVHPALNENRFVVGAAKVGHQLLGRRDAMRPEDRLKVLTAGLLFIFIIFIFTFTFGYFFDFIVLINFI
ncbi:hypothetical protein TYRP_017154 [Tyrophagus putrescentiae]|nr:hypothetical protein TYRP_023199 [Tyrophagus putrescentiae]KAH9401749.1 hypothetical protein TYRP_017154 [Tyrophagus putrescentiae]